MSTYISRITVRSGCFCRCKTDVCTLLYRFFVLPSDAEDFKLDLAQNRSITYIRKPAASSRGRGVRVVKDPKALDLSTLTDVILQHYVPDPLLIGGRKFDLRVYVAVTCLDPLRLYVYREGKRAAPAPELWGRLSRVSVQS